MRRLTWNTRCPVCEHKWADHARDESGCLKNCGPSICPCKRLIPPELRLTEARARLEERKGQP